MARSMKPLVRSGGYYPSNRWTPLVYPGGYTTANGGEEPAPPPIEKTITGNPIHILDALAKPAQALSVKLEPIQDLNGYDNPWPAGGGKNLFNVSSGQSATTRGVTATYDGTNGLIYSGSPTDVGFIGSWVLPTPLTLTDGTYSISIKTPVNFRFCIVSSWANVADILSSQNKKTFTLSETKTIDRLCLFLDDSSIVGTPINVHIEDIQIETGPTATTYAPYSNICPISGWDSVTVNRTGKNLNPWEGANFTADTYPSGFWLNAGNYVFSLDTGGSFGYGNSIYIKLKDRDGNVITDGNISGAGWSLNSTRQYYYGFGGNFTSAPFTLLTDCFFCFGFNNTKPTANGVQLEVGSTATAYEPYQGQTYTIPLGTTVYGGTLDVTTGKLTVDRAMATVTGASVRNVDNSPWPYVTIQSTPFLNIKSGVLTDLTAAGECLSDQFVLYHYTSASGHPNTFYFNAGGTLFLREPTAIDTASVATAQASLNANPVSVVYPLETPIVYDLTPTEITTLLGTNNVWSDSNGDLTLTYLADGNASEIEALNILLGNRYYNNHEADEPTDREALDILLGGTR